MEYNNKKAIAFIGEHTIGIVIAVLCIFLLIYFGAKLANFSTQQQDLAKAEGNLNSITAFFGRSEFASGSSVKYLITAPKNWFLIYFGKTSSLALVQAPKDCTINCLCICSSYFDNDINLFIPDCIEYKCKYLDNYEIEESLPVAKAGIEILPTNVFISKLNNKILIETTENGYKSSSDIFSKLLDFKKDQDSKTNLNLINKYSELGGCGKMGLIYDSTGACAILNEIKNNLESFSKNENIEGYSLSIMDPSGDPAFLFIEDNSAILSGMNAQTKEITINNKKYLISFTEKQKEK